MHVHEDEAISSKRHSEASSFHTAEDNADDSLLAYLHTIDVEEAKKMERGGHNGANSTSNMSFGLHSYFADNATGGEDNNPPQRLDATRRRDRFAVHLKKSPIFPEEISLRANCERNVAQVYEGNLDSELDSSF